MKLTKEQALEILSEENENSKILQDTVIDKRRWSVTHELVFELDGKVWITYYSEAATESQDESPWEYEKEVECFEAVQVHVPKWIVKPK